MKPFKLILIGLVVIGAFFFLKGFALGSDSGALSPGTMADDATVGTVAWTNPGNATSSDNVYATASGGAGGANSHYLKATNFGFLIPTGATINGILVEIEKKRTGVGTTAVDNEVKIVKSDGTIGTTNKGDAITNWPTSDAYISYGNSSDLWDETWAHSDINDVDFGVVLSANPGGFITASVDHIRITVYYTEASGTTQSVQVKGGNIQIRGGRLSL